MTSNCPVASKKVESIIKITGIIGFAIEFLSFVFQVSQGDSKSVFVLRWLGIGGILVWVIWVTISIHNIQKGIPQKAWGKKENTGMFEGFDIKQVYFDGTNRPFFDDLTFGPGDDRKGTDIENAEIAKAFQEGKVVRIERLHSRVRFILSIRRYLNTTLAKSNDFIPADNDESAKGKFIRYIYFEYYGSVQNKPYDIKSRIRNTKGEWLKVHGNPDDYVFHKDRISTKSWEKFNGILGPVRADEPCYFSLDIQPGPSGNTNCLFIKDLKVVELREHDNI